MESSVYTLDQRLKCDCEKLFAVIADVARYPDFLPGWKQVETEKQADGSLRVVQHVGLGPFELWFNSIAWIEPPWKITVKLESPTVTGLGLQWYFVSGPDGGCLVESRLEVTSRNPFLHKLLEYYTQRTARQLLQRFSGRVENLYAVTCKLL